MPTRSCSQVDGKLTFTYKKRGQPVSLGFELFWCVCMLANNPVSVAFLNSCSIYVSSEIVERI